MKRKEITDYDDNTKFPNRIVCRALPQPARFNDQPITFVISVKLTRFNATFIDTKITWPTNIKWVQLDHTLPPQPHSLTPRITDWPADFLETWKQDILW